MPTIVVTGATGSVGGQVTAQLAETSAQVRIVGRDAERLKEVAARWDAEPFLADLTVPATLAAALDGADAAFLVFPSVSGDNAAPATVAALTTAVPRVVYLSAAVPTDAPSPIAASHVLLEQLLSSSAAEPTFLRASGFATNTLGWAEQLRAGDELRWFGPDVTRSLVHEADLAAVAVRALLEPGHAGVHHLTGPEQFTQVEQLATIGEVLGRSLRFVDVGAEGAAELFPALPAEVVASIVEGQAEMAAHPEPMTRQVEQLTGRPARTYAQWVRDHAEAFGGAR